MSSPTGVVTLNRKQWAGQQTAASARMLVRYPLNPFLYVQKQIDTDLLRYYWKVAIVGHLRTCPFTSLI